MSLDKTTSVKKYRKNEDEKIKYDYRPKGTENGAQECLLISHFLNSPFHIQSSVFLPEENEADSPVHCMQHWAANQIKSNNAASQLPIQVRWVNYW